MFIAFPWPSQSEPPYVCIYIQSIHDPHPTSESVFVRIIPNVSRPNPQIKTIKVAKAVKKTLEEQGRAHQEASHKLERRLQAALKAAEVVMAVDWFIVAVDLFGLCVCNCGVWTTEIESNRPNHGHIPTSIQRTLTTQAAEARAAEAAAEGAGGAMGAGKVVDVDAVKEVSIWRVGLDWIGCRSIWILCCCFFSEAGASAHQIVMGV